MTCSTKLCRRKATMACRGECAGTFCAGHAIVPLPEADSMRKGAGITCICAPCITGAVALLGVR